MKAVIETTFFARTRVPNDRIKEPVDRLPHQKQWKNCRMKILWRNQDGTTVRVIHTYREVMP